VKETSPVFNTPQNPIVKFSQNAISHPEKTGFSVGFVAEPLPNLIKFPQVLKVSFDYLIEVEEEDLALLEEYDIRFLRTNHYDE